MNFTEFISTILKKYLSLEFIKNIKCQHQKENNHAFFAKEKVKYGHLKIKEVFQTNVKHVKVQNI